ncbi:MAG: hypothetical protein JKY93_12440 [Gammaproteobacteria bacterium]|nr:hypothetical protein [Gammaproteobacteria bacterium]
MAKKNKANGNQKLVVEGSPEQGKFQTEADKMLEIAREKQEAEQLHEQTRMERLHVSAMAMQGMLASNHMVDPGLAAIKAVEFADALLLEIGK